MFSPPSSALRAVASYPAVTRRMPTAMLRSRETIAIYTKFTSWHFISPRDLANRHRRHEKLLDDMIQHHQNEELRRAMSVAVHDPSIADEKAFMEWVEKLEIEEFVAESMSFAEEERIAIEEMRADMNGRLWYPFRNASEESLDRDDE